MPSVDEFELVRQLLAAPGPSREVTVAGQASLEALAAAEVPARRTSRPSQGRPGPRRVRALVACGAVLSAVAAAAVVVALRPAAAGGPGAGPLASEPAWARHHGGGPGAAGTMDPAAVQRAILTAVTSAGGDILYLQRSSEPATPSGVTQEWFWPSQPQPGQQVRLLIVESTGVELVITFTAVAGDQYTAGSSTGPAITGTEVIIDNRDRSFSTRHDVTIRPQLPDATSVSELRQDIAANVWSVAGHTTLVGQPAIELVTTRPGANGLTEQLWVNAGTFLPLRQVKQDWNGPGSTLTYDVEYLPATTASEAKLLPAVPSGYRQVPG
jgi:hypothetical protein